MTNKKARRLSRRESGGEENLRNVCSYTLRYLLAVLPAEVLEVEALLVVFDFFG